MKRKNKKGSSLVMVIFVTAIIFMVGTVMLALVQTDYKARIQRSESIKSLYSADSGLTLVNNAIRKEAEAAMFCAANQVTRDINGGNYTFIADGVIDKAKYEKINNTFKYYFITALTSNDKTNNDELQNVSNITVDTQSLCNAVINKKYNDITGAGNDIYSISNLSDFKNIADSNAEGSNAVITIEGINVKRYDVSPKDIENLKKNESDKNNLKQKLEDIQNYTGDNYIKIKVKSKFETTNAKTKTKSTKVITTTYTVNAPDYDEVLTASYENVRLINYPFLRAITCDGDLVYNPEDKKTTNGVTINGAVWTKGSLENTADESQKYDSGIIINGGNFKVQGLNDLYGNKLPDDIDSNDSENINGAVLCNSSISMTGNCNVTLPDVYTRNVYAGNVHDNDGKLIGTADKIDLKVKGNVITNNDLVINSSNTNYDITKSYYGINDVIGSVNDSEVALTRRSSSIIVNKDDKNTLNINKDAYINGVAFLDVDNEDSKDKILYETGESVAIQGNYKTYTEVLPDDDEKSLEYVDAYTLIGGYASDKASHFIHYYTDGNKAKNGGVSIGNVYALGATVNKNADNTDINGMNICDTNENEDGKSGIDVIADKKLDYCAKVLLMDCILPSETDKLNAGEIYNKYEVSRSVLGKNDDKYACVLNFDKYIEDCKKADPNKEPDRVLVTGSDESNIFKSKYYKTLFDANDNDVIVIKNDGVYIDGNKKIEDVKGAVNAVILTKNNVVFDSTDGDIDFHGTVVAGGNVEMKGNNNINITFDKKQVQYALAEQKIIYPSIEAALYSSYFIQYNEGELVAAKTKLNGDGSYTPSYNSKKLKEGFWKLGANNGSK